MKLEGLKINFLGDSITEAAGTSDPKYVFWRQLGERTGAVCRGYGIGGTRIAKQTTPSSVARYDRYFASRIDEMDPDADVIVVFGGTNDYGHGDAPLGTMADRTPDTFTGACHDLITRLEEKYPAKPIVICTPIHRKGESEIHVKVGTQPTVLQTYVDIIKEVAAYYGCPVLDLFRVSGIQPDIPSQAELLTKDGLHPNDLGNSLICDRLAGFLGAL
ncbi:MAG: SGNH/GDSL hydrolase family protein [Clostridia bacterium]|nr:SGNH/GDSL hydrolase family protein [Clostridia bacterium]